jgi:multiple sugar transport system permease protein
MREARLAYILIAPAVLFLAIFVAYPFVMALWMSLTSKRLGMPGAFIGLGNFFRLLDDDIFRQTAWNAVLYTGVAVGVKTVAGLALAMGLAKLSRGAQFIRAIVLLPWVIPISLSALAWWWMYDPLYSVFNWGLGQIGIQKVPWLSNPTWARVAIITTNIWRGLPFYGLCILAGLLAIPRELYEAAETDGAGRVATFWYVTLPLLRPVLGTVILYSVVMTISDFETIYLITRGGPRNTTHLFSTLAYQVGLVGTEIGLGAAIVLFIFPVLAVAAFLLIRLVRQSEQIA